MTSLCNTTEAQRIIGIVECLRLRGSKRLTVKVIRNQSRPFGTSSQLMVRDFSQIVGLRRSFAQCLIPEYLKFY